MRRGGGEEERREWNERRVAGEQRIGVVNE